MQFTIQQPALLQAFSVATSAVEQRPAHPIRGYVLAKREGNLLALSARNEEFGVRYRVRVDSWGATSGEDDSPEEVLLPPLLGTYVRHLPRFPVAVEAQRTSCEIRCQRAVSRLNTIGADPREFPVLPIAQKTGRLLFQVEAGLLREIIDEVAFAAGEDQGHLHFSALCLEIAKGTATFVATNSFRLALRAVPIPDAELEHTLFVPAKAMKVLASMLPGMGMVDLLLSADQHQFLVHTAQLDFATSTLHTTFPAYRNAMPQGTTTRARVRIADLLAAIRLTQPFATKENKEQLALTFRAEAEQQGGEEQVLEISAVADVGFNENVVAARVEGPTNHVSLNAGFVTDALMAIQEEEAEIHCNGPRSAVVIRPVGPRGSQHVMMPLTSSSQRPPVAAQPSRREPALAAR